MRTIALLALLPVAVGCGDALGGDGAAPRFPEDWRGLWRGDLEVVSAGGRTQTVPMELSIEATDAPDRFRWALRYGEQPVRDYLLRTENAEAGRYVIDERNSIQVPARLLGGELVSIFAVGGNRLTARYRLSGETLEFEILVATDEPAGKTGGKDGVPEVSVFDVGAVQRARLARRRD